MVKAIAFLDGRTEVDPTVDFDDSVIEDGNAVIDKNIKLVTAKLRSKITAIMEIEKCDENTAREELGTHCGGRPDRGKADGLVWNGRRGR